MSTKDIVDKTKFQLNLAIWSTPMDFLITHLYTGIIKLCNYIKCCYDIENEKMFSIYKHKFTNINNWKDWPTGPHVVRLKIFFKIFKFLASMILTQKCRPKTIQSTQTLIRKFLTKIFLTSKIRSFNVQHFSTFFVFLKFFDLQKFGLSNVYRHM